MTLLLGGSRRRILPASKKGFSPQQYFQNGEAGAWYDPSDLTAEKVAWRRNLLTWSQEFDNAAWTKGGTGTGSAPVVTANAAVAPDGTTSADLVAFNRGAGNTVSDQSQLTASGITVAAAVAYTGSVYIKAATAGDVGKQIAFRHVGAAAYQIITLTASYVRIEKAENAFTTSGGFEITNRGTFTADNTVSVHLWGAQLERGPTATAYQRITDFTSDFLAAFPTHALYQDSAGTTPVTALGQPVGLAIDKSRGGLASLGAELVTNGDFSSGTGWTATTGWTISGGTANAAATTTTANPGFSQSGVSLTPGRMVYWTITASNFSAGSFAFRIYGSGGSDVLATISANGTYRGFATVRSDATGQIGLSHAAGLVCSIDNVSVREVPGVHAIQPTSASRPLLDGRVNLFVSSDEVGTGTGWAIVNGTVTANAAVAPDGTTTADAYTPSAVSTSQQIAQVGTGVASSYIQSIAAKANGYSFIQMNNAANTDFANFDLSTGTVGTVSGVTASIEPLGNGWYRCTTVYAPLTPNVNFRFQVVPSASATRAQAFTGNGTSGVLFWRADFRLAADAAYPYQRVAAATDYADVGVPRAFAFDGFDDSLYTASNMDLSGTDKVTVLAGVRKLSDAATGMLAELGPNATVTNGTFGLIAPSATGANSYRFISRGATTQVSAGTGVFAAAPDTSVLTGIGNIAAPLCELRRNAASVQATTASQGGGNYTSNVLHIGRSNNASSPFNGKAYQLIVRGALTEGNALRSGEVFVGQKTGVAL